MKLMNYLVILAVAVASASAAKEDVEAPIVSSNFEVSPEGNYRFAYETGNGIYAQAVSNVKNADSENPGSNVEGHYSYKDPEGKIVDIVYVADENGYRPRGSHLPLEPEQTLRTWAYINSHPPQVKKSKLA